MSKKIIAPVPIIVAGDMSGNLTSTVLRIQFHDSVSMQINITTANAIGTFEVQGSLDYEVNDSGEVVNAGNWVDLVLTPAPVAAGVSESILIDMFGLSFPFIRLHYTATSGTGSVTALGSAKEV